MMRTTLYLTLVAGLLLACEEATGAGTSAAAETQEPSQDDTKTAQSKTDSKPEAKPNMQTSQSGDKAIDYIGDFIAAQDIDTTMEGWKTRLPKPPQATFEEGATYFWNLQTNKGDIKIEFMPHVAPMHVSSTIYLTQLGFYDDITFHRVIPTFMAQGGCPLGNGHGGPGYKFGGEFDPGVKHDQPGLLSMANAGAGTDGSQFFLTFVPTPHLDGKHTIFGKIVEGMNTLKQLESLGSRSGQTKELLKIEKATITTS